MITKLKTSGFKGAKPTRKPVPNHINKTKQNNTAWVFPKENPRAARLTFEARFSFSLPLSRRRAKPDRPKDRDGVPYRRGDVVWDVEDWTEWCVTKADEDGVFIAFEDVSCQRVEDPTAFTHRPPAIGEG